MDWEREERCRIGGGLTSRLLRREGSALVERERLPGIGMGQVVGRTSRRRELLVDRMLLALLLTLVDRVLVDLLPDQPNGPLAD